MPDRGRFRGGGRRLGAPKRQIGNIGLETIFNSLTTIVGTVKVAATTGLNTVAPAATLVRTRGELLLTTTTAIAGAKIFGAFGMIIVSSQT